MLGATVVAGCGADTSDTSPLEAPTAPAIGPSAPPAPVPGDAVPYSPVTVDGDTTTQSHQIAGRSPYDVIIEYRRLATGEGWLVDTPPTPSGTTELRMTLHQGDETVLATTTPAVDPHTSGATELSIELTVPG